MFGPVHSLRSLLIVKITANEMGLWGPSVLAPLKFPFQALLMEFQFYSYLKLHKRATDKFLEK